MSINPRLDNSREDTTSKRKRDMLFVFIYRNEGEERERNEISAGHGNFRRFFQASDLYGPVLYGLCNDARACLCYMYTRTQRRRKNPAGGEREKKGTRTRERGKGMDSAVASYWKCK